MSAAHEAATAPRCMPAGPASRCCILIKSSKPLPPHRRHTATRVHRTPAARSTSCLRLGLHIFLHCLSRLLVYFCLCLSPHFSADPLLVRQARPSPPPLPQNPAPSPVSAAAADPAAVVAVAAHLLQQEEPYPSIFSVCSVPSAVWGKQHIRRGTSTRCSSCSRRRSLVCPLLLPPLLLEPNASAGSAAAAEDPTQP